MSQLRMSRAEIISLLQSRQCYDPWPRSKAGGTVCNTTAVNGPTPHFGTSWQVRHTKYHTVWNDCHRRTALSNVIAWLPGPFSFLIPFTIYCLCVWKLVLHSVNIMAVCWSDDRCYDSVELGISPSQCLYCTFISFFFFFFFSAISRFQRFLFGEESLSGPFKTSCRSDRRKFLAITLVVFDPVCPLLLALSLRLWR